MAGLTLYKACAAWGLPSYSAASLQAEAYCRLAGLEIAAESRSSASASPSGQLPAFEDAGGLHMPVLENENNEFEAARSVIEIAKTHTDLDAELTPQQRSLCTAFIALIRLHLEPASLYTTWGEPESYDKYVKSVVGAELPFPLSLFGSHSQKRKALQLVLKQDRNQMYDNAASCYRALADHLQSTNGKFLLGDKPSSADAFLFGHLCLHLRAPISAPELRQATEQNAGLRDYASRLFEIFGQPLPSPPPASENPDWVERQTHTNGHRRSNKTQITQAEKNRRWHNWLWLGGTAAVFALYVIYSGNVIEFEYEADEEEIDED